MARRIVIKGTSGAGKSTLGRALAERLDVPYVELDALHHGPNWSAASSDVLRARVLQALRSERGWVVDGNYDRKLGNTVLARAELVVWLDLALGTKLWRLAQRTVRRRLHDEPLWNGNRETLASVFWGREALFPWTVQSHVRQRRDWPAQLRAHPHVRLRSAREVEAWLRTVPRASSSA